MRVDGEVLTDTGRFFQSKKKHDFVLILLLTKAKEGARITNITNRSKRTVDTSWKEDLLFELE